ncbi:hypothetical protein [Paraburkholderia gardini]|uniref:hypothetical protein n=1 Tax=Paraburkholderia gardini TaxID=2823469 RepID=UPI001E448137|nr:hypothetical protein [Paraburkholderia gardini]
MALSHAPFDPLGKTVGQVVRQVEQALARTEIEPEWVSVANIAEDNDEALYGLRSEAEWPDTQAARRRLSLSVQRGTSEGWIVQADYVHFVENGPAGTWQSFPLMRIKSLSRSQAWAVAAVVARLLDID